MLANRLAYRDLGEAYLDQICQSRERRPAKPDVSAERASIAKLPHERLAHEKLAKSGPIARKTVSERIIPSASSAGAGPAGA